MDRRHYPTVNLVEPKEGMSICDPTCGSGGMLIESMKYVAQHGGNPRNLVLEEQEANYGTLGMCKMNMVLHGILVNSRFRYILGTSYFKGTKSVLRRPSIY